MIDDAIRNIIYYAEAFIKRPLLAILPACLVLLGAAAVILTMPRKYESEALIMVESSQMPTSLVTATAASERLQFLEQRILAREKLLALADRFDLFPALRQTSSNTAIARIVREHITIQTFAPEASDRYANTSTMRIGFQYTSAKEAAAVASELVRMVIDENSRLRRSRASETSQFITREVDKLKSELKAREDEWRQYFQDNSESLPVRIPSLLSELQEKDREIGLLNQSISALDQELRLLEAQLRLGKERTDTVVRQQIQLASLETELETKSLTYSQAHPEIRALSQKIAGLKDQAAPSGQKQSIEGGEELSPELALISARIAIANPRQKELLAQRTELSEQIATLRTAIARAPQVESQLQAIDRERQSMQNSLTEMQNKLSTARLGERLEIDNSAQQIQVVEKPEVPRFPSAPSRTRLLLIALVAALLCGAGALYVGDSLQTTIRGTFDLKSLLAGSTVVIVPYWSADPSEKATSTKVLDLVANACRRERTVGAS